MTNTLSTRGPNQHSLKGVRVDSVTDDTLGNLGL